MCRQREKSRIKFMFIDWLRNTMSETETHLYHTHSHTYECTNTRTPTHAYTHTNRNRIQEHKTSNGVLVAKQMKAK